MGPMQKYIWIIIPVIFLVSCNSYEKLTYLKDIPETGDDSLFIKVKDDYTIQPDDILYIRVIARDQEVSDMFNLFSQGQNNNSNFTRGGSLYYTSYLVDDSGKIDMPVVRKIHVQGLTIPEIEDTIVNRLKKYIKEPQILLRLGYFKFVLLGEVHSKGINQVQETEINIMEALAHGGGITYNGNRENILIIRQTPEGSRTFRIDLTDKNLILSKHFYIQPNDVIYVEPLKTTLFRETATDYLFVLSTVTSVLTTITLILNFISTR